LTLSPKDSAAISVMKLGELRAGARPDVAAYRRDTLSVLALPLR
jgi:hypothetical protein